MNRFIRYLYEYENGKRIRNVGFVKVEAGDEETIVHMQAKGFQNSEDRKLELYLFYVENENIVRIRQAETRLTGPALSEHLICSRSDIEDSRGVKTYEMLSGILIETGSGRRIAATWDDKPVDVSRVKEFEPERSGEPEQNGELEQGVESGQNIESGKSVELGQNFEADSDSEPGWNLEEDASNEPGRKEEEMIEAILQEGELSLNEMKFGRGKEKVEQDNLRRRDICFGGKRITKIQRKDISKLPRCEWKLANNQFLVHGYNNFHHLLLIEQGNYLKLGVPGIYHIEEAKCADMFGFEEFISAEELRIGPMPEQENMEKGEWFGYWCRPVRGKFR